MGVRARVSVGLALAGLLHVACATKVAATSPGPFSTLDPTLVVSSLDALQAPRLCIDLQLFATTALTDDQLRDYECVAAYEQDQASGLLDASQCKTTVNDCVTRTDPSSLRAPFDFGACGQFAVLAINCNVTVGQLGECLSDYGQSMAMTARSRATVCDDSSESTPDPAAVEPLVLCAGCADLVTYALSIMRGGPATDPGL